MDTAAQPECYSCWGTGKIKGFGMDGKECPCIAHCLSCSEVIVWGHDDEAPPKRCNKCKENPDE